ncbi:virion RNA polymerase protein [Rhizobium phage RHph_I1_6]|uniref:Virion RNA polymerase protein n=1 Tax=Rhizobium phage RHph_I1_6 TaxID=2509728 RepID=A0A7S5RMZ0_9CAUD|nr:virion RNA polymerase protein [Rhizobium phage RHph_I1_6]QIG76594.1 virion RNA polymerase protein [Rhizobium phage RHph_I1_6]
MVDFPQGPLSPLDQQRVLRADTTARVTEALAAATAPKQVELSTVSQGKKALLGGASDMIAAAVKNENAPAQDQFILDAQVMSPFDLEAKYGPGSAQAQRNLRGAQNRSQQTTDLASNQNEVDSLGDLANSTVQGIVGLGSGLAGLAVSPFSSEKATGIVEAGNEFNKTLQSFQSDALRQARQEEAVASEVESADNKAQQENDSWQYGAGGAGLLRIGRDAAGALDRSTSSTPLANDLVGSALGSLVAAGPVAKVLKGVGVAEAASVPASIGIQEGGGSYAQTVTDVLNDPEVVNSPLYQERIAAGDTPDEAKRFVANRAGQTAAPAQALAAAVTGKIVSKFEGNPFKPTSVLGAAKNIGKELLEEIPQTASGDLISNVVQKDVSNPNKDVLEGVGESIGKTVPGVIGSTAIAQAPGVGIHAIASAAREVYQGGATLIERANDNLNKRNEQASPVSAEKVEAASNELIQLAPKIAEKLVSQIPANASPKDSEQAQSYINNIQSSMKMSPEEVASQPFQMDTDNRIEALIQNGKRAADKNLSEEDRLHSALWVLDQMTKNDALFNQDIPKAFNQLEEDHPDRAELDSYLTGLQFLNNHPVLRAVADQINQMQQTREVSPAEVTQSVANDTADLAAYNPAGVNATTANSVLYQADRGFVALNPAQRAALENKVSLLRATQKFKADLETLEATPKAKTPEQVAEEIIGQSLDKAFPSMNDHLGTIAQAIKRGDNKGARYAAQRLMKFAKHMSSKVNALNHSYDAKGEEKEYGSAGQKIYYSSPRLAKQIYAEAKMVVEVANSVAKNMPEFGIMETPVVSLRPAIRGINAKTYTRTSSDAFEAKPEPKIEPKVEATPAPLVQESKPVEPVEETKVEAVQVPEETPSKGVEEVTSVAQEKEQTEGVGTESEPEARTVENAFPNLIQGSNFRTSFNLAEEGNTLAGNQTPFQTIMDALVNQASLINQRGSGIRYAYDAKLGRSYADYLGFARPIFGSLRNSLKEYFTKETTYNEKKTTRAALFEQGVTFLDSIEGRALNILEQSDKGLAYNQELIQKAILAGLHWNLNADKQIYRQTEEELRQAYGLSQDAVLDDTTLKALNRGVSIAEAKRSLGDLITKFWGIKGKDNAPLGFTKGIPEGVAAEVLVAMSEVGLVSFVKIDLPNGKTPIRVMFDTRDEKIQEKIEALDSAPAVIADAILIENPDDPHIGEPPTKVPDTQMRNPLTKNTAQQKIVIQRANNIPFYVNESVMNFLDDIGENDLIDLMGGMSKIPDGLNKNHRKSIEGVNTGIKNSYRNTQRQLKEIESHARIAGVHITEMPQYYEHNISRVGRLHMQGSANPQADKIARELFVATVSQLDLTNPDHKQAFFLTLAQALGVKTELKAPQLAVEEVQKKLAGEFKDAADHVSAWRSGSSKIDPDVLKKSLGKDLTMKAIHALIAWHDYRKDDNATEFTHYLSLEADGKTDGPINAIMNFTAGEFTAYWVQNMARGGLYIGEIGKTLADHYSSSEENSKDLYQTATDKLVKNIADFRKSIVGTPVEPMMGSLLRTMSALTGDLSFESDTGKLTLKRGIAKNPLTITVYGSGIDGIAGKVAGGLVDALYEGLSAVGSGNKSTLADVFGIENSTQFMNDLNYLIHKGIVVTEDGAMEVKEYPSKDRNMNDPEFTFTPGELLNLKNNVKALFVRQLDASIREMMGPSMVTTKRVQTAIQVMSLVAKDVFDKEVNARLDAKEKRGRHNFLSQRELNEIYKQTAQYHPVIDTGTQEFFIGGTERGDLGSKTFSKTLSGQLQTTAYVYSPSEAGVGGVPYMVIGTGDGQMVQNIFANTNIDNVLAVFDGIELPASKIKEYSEQINKAVYDAWQANPVADIASAFRAFVRRNPLSLDLSDETKAKLDRTLEGLSIEDLAQVLQQDAESIAARKAALNQVPLSVDHMASAAAPYSSGSGETTGVGFESFPAIADTMNKIVGANAVVDKAVPVSTDAMDLVSVGRVDEFNNRIIPVKELPNIPGLDPSHAEVIRLGAKNISSDWHVVVGTPVSLNSFELQSNPNSVPGEYGLGKIDFAMKTIYITNPSSETLAHEILHASTFAKVQSFYQGLNTSTEEQEAIVRLEGLLGEFVASVYNGESSAVIGAREMADGWIHKYLNDAAIAEDAKDKQAYADAMASAVNEFMAWVLTNKNLATVASETKVLNPAFRLIGKALAFIRNLIFGGGGPKVGDDLWSNLRFNTRVLLSTPVDNNTVGDTRLYQSAQFGSSDRLTNLADRFFSKVTVALKTDDATVKTEIEKYVVDTIDLADSFENHGWSMSQQERSVFTSVVAALGVANKLDETALAGIDTLYSHAMKSLTVEDLMDDPNSNDPNDRYMAQERYNSLHGIFGTIKDPNGRSSLMPSFLALAIVNQRLQSVLRKLSLPKTNVPTQESYLDQLITEVGMSAIDKFTTILSGQKGGSVDQAINSLAQVLVAQQDEDKFFILNQVGNKISAFENYVRENTQNLTDKWDNKLKTYVASNPSNKWKSFAATMSRMTLGIINDNVASSIAESVTGILNRQEGWTTLREFFGDLSGRLDSNAPIWDMITKVRTLIQQTRQQFREQLPAKIAGHFTKKLSSKEWEHLFKGMAKTDLASLVEGIGVEKTLEILESPAAVAQELQKLQLRLRSLDPVNEQKLMTKVSELAVFMNTGEASANLLRNAFAIANLLGEGGRKARATQELIDVIDQLVTLTAIDKLDRSVMKTLSTLVQDEPEGMEFTLAYLTGQRKNEMARVTNDVAKANHYKGWIPLENENGHQLTIINDHYGTQLLPLGFKRVADYKGSKAEGTGVSRGYYYAPVSGKTTYNQGILQTVHSTASGVDPVTGQTIGTVNGGVIRDAAEVARITRRRGSNGGFEALLPVYDALGDVVAYERRAHPQEVERLNPNRNLSEMLGAWKGRQVEEQYAREFNSELIKNLAHVWGKTKVVDHNQFVDLFASKDKVIADAVKLISPEVKAEIEREFGGKEFWVRKDMVNDAVGFRQASVGDAWNGATRWSDATVKRFRKIATAIFDIAGDGNNAYKYLVKSEELLQKGVFFAKNNIVVKSVIVPVSNILSNMWQLLHVGVPVKDIIRGMGTKTIEVNKYIQNKSRQIELEADLRVAEVRKDVRAIRKLQTEWDQLEDSNKRLSIWKLIEEGEFTAISQGGPTQEDLALSKGKYIDYVEELAKKLPGPLKTVGRYAVVSQDTAMFKALARATQYGDFLAKGILYDHLRKTMPHKEAVAKVSQGFINYNKLAGRTRTYLESIGILWFWNFKIRSVKVALEMVRNNPLRALLSMSTPVLPIVGSIGTPMSDNFFSVLADGKLGYSIGPGMGLNSPWLNPWLNLVR